MCNNKSECFSQERILAGYTQQGLQKSFGNRSLIIKSVKISSIHDCCTSNTIQPKKSPLDPSPAMFWLYGNLSLNYTAYQLTDLSITGTSALHRLTPFFQMFPFDPPEYIRKPVFWCFQLNQRGTLGRKELTQIRKNKKEHKDGWKKNCVDFYLARSSMTLT